MTLNSAKRHQPEGAVAKALLAGTALAACGGVGPVPTPPREGELGGLDWSATTAFLDSATASGTMPGAVLGVSLHPSRDNSRIGPVRRDLADHVVLSLMPDAKPRPDAVVEAR